jgi:hypothetical protein
MSSATTAVVKPNPSVMPVLGPNQGLLSRAPVAVRGTHILARLPEDLFRRATSFLGSFNELASLAVTSNEMMTATCLAEEVRLRALLPLAIAERVDAQLRAEPGQVVGVTKLRNGVVLLWPDKETLIRRVTEPVFRPQATFLTVEDVKAYKLAIATLSDRIEIEEQIRAFEEKLVDSLCAKRNKGSLLNQRIFATGHFSTYKFSINTNRMTQLIAEYADPFFNLPVFVRACRRELGEVHLCQSIAVVVGPKQVKEGSPARRFGQYGTSGGMLASVQTWIMSQRCSYWQAERGASLFEESGRIEHYLPAVLFIGKREGDAVSFEFKGKEVKLVLRQKYAVEADDDFGEQVEFEVMLERILRGSSRTMDPQLYDPPLSRDEQTKIVRAAHAAHVAALANPQQQPATTAAAAT